MNDPWNPSVAEVQAWAYTEGAVEPTQDWDLCLMITRHEDLYLELVADDHCPNRKYFLRVLYLTVGNAVRTKFRSLPRPIVEGFIARGSTRPHPDIAVWMERSRTLLAHPEQFNYDDWCAGGLVEKR